MPLFGFLTDLQNSARNTTRATISAIKNGPISFGEMPTKVLVKPLATATAGLLKKVDEVNQ